MVDAWFLRLRSAVPSRKTNGFVSAPVFDRLLKDAVVAPELDDRFFSLRTVQAGGDLFEARGHSFSPCDLTKKPISGWAAMGFKHASKFLKELRRCLPVRRLFRPRKMGRLISRSVLTRLANFIVSLCLSDTT